MKTDVRFKLNMVIDHVGRFCVFQTGVIRGLIDFSSCGLFVNIEGKQKAGPVSGRTWTSCDVNGLLHFSLTFVMFRQVLYKLLTLWASVLFSF